MRESEYPKVLVLGHQFDDRTGLGITLANLFANWPKERLSIMAPLIDVEKCEKARPCIKYIGRRQEARKQETKPGLRGTIRAKIRSLYYYLGINERNYSFPYKEDEVIEAQRFQPDIVFTCLGSLNSMKNCLTIMQQMPSSKLVLYIVDDWVNTKENNRLFSGLWRKENDKHFRLLLDKADGLLSICPYMSEIYKEKYNKKFLPFHNPVDNNYWNSLPLRRKYGPGEKGVLYVGKINVDTKQCLIDVASVIESLNHRTASSGYKYYMDVYTPDFGANKEMFKKNSSSNVKPPVSHDEIPRLMKSYDALLLTLGFSKRSREYVRLSMPTKVSEYMASGIPTILYCPEEIALARYLEPKGCTISCFQRDQNKLASAISVLDNDSYCQKIVTEALETAKRHDIQIVRQGFEKALMNFNH